MKTKVHNVKIADEHIEVAYTDGQGHFWFEAYTEKQMEDYLNERIFICK